jgi:hypothetical protein
MVGSEADHEPVPPNLLHTQAWIGHRQGYDCGVDIAGGNLFHKMGRVAVRRPDRAVGEQLLVHVAESMKERRIGLRRAAEFQCRNLAAFDRFERGHSFIPRIKQSPGNPFERDAGRGELDTTTLGFSVEMQPGVFLELLGLRTQVRLCGVKFFRRSTEPSFL